MVFKNETQLRNFLLAKCRNAVISAEEKVYQIIDECLQQFYSEFSPDEYIRTQQLLRSLVKSNVRQVGNGFCAEVYFDASTLNYVTGVIPTQNGVGYATWDGETVLRVAMESEVPHGGYASGTAVWTTSMARLGNIFDLLRNELIAQGIHVK
jgi:hypothetical protein